MSSRLPFHDARSFAFAEELERAAPEIEREVEALGKAAFEESPDSLTTRRDGYDETGWLYVPLLGEGARAKHLERVPTTLALCRRVPGVVNAGFSLFEPGTHLYPHRGELEGVLRCHLPLAVPVGDVGLRVAGETRTWTRGRALVFDDTFEHDAWNRGATDRVLLLVTFRPGSTAT